jgi:DHA2 family multidrug resistance protein
MELKDLFYTWVPVWLRLPVLFLLFFVILTANAVYPGNSTDMYSGLGVYPEPYTEAFNAVYIGMGLGIMLEWRLKLRFSNKTLLLWGLSMMALANGVNMITDNPALVVLSCLILGFTKMTALVEVYIIWLVVWSRKLDATRLYPFVYLTALGGVYFTTWLTARLAYAYNWRHAYILMLILIGVCFIAGLLLVENHPPRHRLPLYQMDGLGLLLLASFLMLVNYVAVYGRMENWWESEKIQAATCLMPVSFFAFLAREMRVKRPVVPFSLFKKGSFRKGLFFFLLLGIFLPSSIQGTFTAGVLDFENISNARLNLFLIPGVVAGAILSWLWYFFKRNTEVLLFIGLAAFVAYYYVLYTNLATGLRPEDFWFMSLLKGFGTVIMYVVIGLYTTSGFPLNKVLTAAGMMILFRSLLGSGVAAGIYSWLLYAGRVRHFDRLAGSSEADAGGFMRQAGYYRTLQEQATLAASKELCGIIIIIGILLLAAMVFSHFWRLATQRPRILG